MRAKRFYVLAAAILCALTLTACGSYAPVLRANWGVRIPWAAWCREIYEADSGPSPQGDGLRYHVYSYCYEDEMTENLVVWREPEGQTINGTDCVDVADSYLERLVVPPSKRPDYENCLLWYATGEEDPRDELLLFLDTVQNRLYVLECFL
ncbi:MAG: hypothetical protein E7426_04815 [Ruminococcaceae bacterium]|nr:hypothetical protein [Oscillospiraceae bacterium]